MYKKKPLIGRYEAGMLLLVIAACLLRLLLIFHHWPVTNSDEAIMDLIERNISQHGDHPVFFYGQIYMGPLEAYLGALLATIFGNSVTTLRIGLIGLFALFLISVFFLIRATYNRVWALLSVALLSLGGSAMMRQQLLGIGGYPETIFFAALLLMLANYLARTAPSTRDEPGPGKKRQRWLIYGLSGFIIGLSLWTDQLILPFLLVAILLWILFNRHEFLSLTSLWALLGFICGGFPLIYFNLTAPFNENSLFVLLGQEHADSLPTAGISLLQRLTAGYVIALPSYLGLSTRFCRLEDFPFYGPGTTQTSLCITTNAAWSTFYWIGWISAVCMAIISIRRQWKTRSLQQWNDLTRQECVRQCTRLCILLAAILTFCLYISSPTSIYFPTTSNRYLICLFLTWPAILWPLVSLWLIPNPPNPRYLWKAVSAILLLATCIILISGTISVVQNIPAAEEAYQQENELINYLEKIKATHIYTDYWTGYRIAIQSDEKIIPAIVTTNLQIDTNPTSNRYKPFAIIVQKDSHASFVLSESSGEVQKMDQQLKKLKQITYTRHAFGGYVIYQFAKTPHFTP